MGEQHQNTRSRDVSIGYPWLRRYEPGVPATIVVPDHPLPQLLAASAERCPARPAIRFLGRTMTYRALDDAASQFAGGLRGLGVRPGDRVALLLPNCPQLVIAFQGVLRAGAVVVPTSPLEAATELRHRWRDAGVHVVVCLATFYPQVAAVRPDLPALEQIVVADIKEYFPPLTRLLYAATRERGADRPLPPPADGHIHRFRALAAADSGAPTATGGDDLALLQSTGGTTGAPKLAMLTHRNLLANALQLRAWLRNVVRPDGADVVLGVLPLFHAYAITTVMNFTIAGGGTMILQPRFVPRDVLRAIDREHPDFFPGVPTMYRALLDAPDLGRYDLRSLKAAISGAAPLPPALQERFAVATGARIVEGYGLTEASPVTHVTPLMGHSVPGSIGLPLPGTEAAIIDPETGAQRLPPGTPGELAVRGPQVMRGYWRREAETADVLRDGWLRTGDIATMDAEGFFTIIDRKKDLIITGGMNVFPREVEEPLTRHPKVREVVVIGVPDERWGEAVKAYIVLRAGQTATAEEMVAYCRERMARYKVPKQVEFRAALPTNLIGKVLRRALRDEERARQSAQLACGS